MITLGVDTSVSLGGAALWRDGEGVAEMMMESPLSHAEELLPLILRLLEQCGLERDEIDLVSVTWGLDRSLVCGSALRLRRDYVRHWGFRLWESMGRSPTERVLTQKRESAFCCEIGAISYMCGGSWG